MIEFSRLLGLLAGHEVEFIVNHTIEVEIFGVRCRCLDLLALIRTKRAAGHPRELEAVAELEVIWEERQEEKRGDA